MRFFCHPGWSLDRMREMVYDDNADWKGMYCHLAFYADKALSLLEEGKEAEARQMLADAFSHCEEMYISISEKE